MLSLTKTNSFKKGTLYNINTLNYYTGKILFTPLDMKAKYSLFLC